MIYQAIVNFPKQFEFEPIVENKAGLGSYKSFVVCGMGGSNLASEIIALCNPSFHIIFHRSYGLPNIWPEEKETTLVICYSYSGNTEEPIDALQTALSQGYPVAVGGMGGKIIDMARQNSIHYVQIPDIHVQPRMGLGFSLRALMALMQDNSGLEQSRKLAQTLKSLELEAGGKQLAGTLANKIPVIYASDKNRIIAYNWKIKFNETVKIPAFHNVVPEQNHNELTGFDVVDGTRILSEKIHFIFLKDSTDDLRIQKRMEVMQALMRNRELSSSTILLDGESCLEKIFKNSILADWTALYLSQGYGVEPEEVPLVEEFKKLIS